MNRLVLSLTLAALAAPAAAQAGKVDFQKQILPIFEKRCVECHSAAKPDEGGRIKKPKGGVELDSKAGIEKSKRGKAVVAKKPDDSLLYQAITLPADHDDVMPPAKKGDPLSKADTDLIKSWIEEGADFGKWTGAKDAPADKGDEKGGEKGGDDKGGKTDKPSGKPGQKPGKAAEHPLIALQKGVKPIDAKILAGFAEGPFKVHSTGDDSPLLDVTCFGETDAVDDSAMASLLPLAANIAELNLGATQITDKACETIAKMPRLYSLDLRQTAIGNQGAAALIPCKELRSLNLYGTKVSDYGAAALAKLQKLEEIYLWQTDVSPEAIIRLRESIPDVRIVVAAELPEPGTDAPGGNRRRR